MQETLLYVYTPPIRKRIDAIVQKIIVFIVVSIIVPLLLIVGFRMAFDKECILGLCGRYAAVPIALTASSFLLFVLYKFAIGFPRSFALVLEGRKVYYKDFLQKLEVKSICCKGCTLYRYNRIFVYRLIIKTMCKDKILEFYTEEEAANFKRFLCSIRDFLK